MRDLDDKGLSLPFCISSSGEKKEKIALYRKLRAQRFQDFCCHVSKVRSPGWQLGPVADFLSPGLRASACVLSPLDSPFSCRLDAFSIP